jgi:hypothetical protein
MAKYEESQEVENERSKNRQRATRERRAKEKEIKKQRQEALNQATSTSQRRKIKEDAEENTLAIQGPSSSGGDDKGGIYDISTNNYSQPQRNQSGQDSSIEEAGIDTLGAGIGEGLSDSSTNDPQGEIDFNGSVIICIDGEPFYIDIPYDATEGAYAISSGANYPITAP